jgi:2-polyprenyl-6-methoxyphenol hydroxylase-like FAD-dependent oxidoreductase
VPARPWLVDDAAQAKAAWQEMIASDPMLQRLLGDRRFPEDFQRVRRPWGHAARYGAAGALLMGDAAHPVSPAGGQGANMSVADGRAIAELALSGERNLLAAYERVRRPANTRSLRFTRAASLVFNLPEWLLAHRAVLWLGGQVISRPWFQVRGLRLVSRAFVSRS